MEVCIYVVNSDDENVANSLTQGGHSIKVVNLGGADPEGVPPEVLQVVMLKKTETFPLTVIDSNPVLSGELPTSEQLHDWIQNGVNAPAILVDRADSAVDFPTASRIHVSMDVSNIEQAVKFYSVFFGQEPTKVKSDYAKFEVEEPPLNIALNHFYEPRKGGPINHFGVQVKSSDAVTRMKQRFVAADLPIDEEIATECCYAVQTKVWVNDPDGNKWEIFVVTDPYSDEGCGPNCICYKECFGIVDEEEAAEELVA